MLSLDLIDSPCLPAVLAALQFWLGLVLPTVLLARMQCRQYVAWRLRQRQVRQKERQLRRQEAESWGFGLREPSSSSSNSDAGSSDGNRSDGDRGGGASKAHCGSGSGKGCASWGQQQPQQSQQPQQAAQRSRPRWPQWGGPVAAHPDDWQYEAAGRLLHAARLTPQRLALLLPLALSLYCWHTAFFPA